MTITAKIIKDSTNPWGKRITTWELEYPRLVHSEFMTHRQFSRNAASSRAIPIAKVIEQVKTNPAMPFKWGVNQAGMQAKENVDSLTEDSAIGVWLAARDSAVAHAQVLVDMGLHKQVVNRLLEPFQHIKVVLTTTEYANWKWLRLHTAADPTIYELARVIDVAREESTPEQLKEGHWHLPYVHTEVINSIQYYFDDNGNEISLEQAQKISVSSCGQVSYRKLDTSLEKAEDIYQRLVESKPVHASPTEHQAVVIDLQDEQEGFIKGCTAVATKDIDMDDAFEIAPSVISGNFTGGWLQYRQMIPDNVKF